MCGYGRTEAGIFMGVLLNCDDNSETHHDRGGTSRSLPKPCANLLFGELKESKFQHPRYLATVIRLVHQASELMRGLEALAEDRSFSPKMRTSSERS
jgi:hypothetical protein